MISINKVGVIIVSFNPKVENLENLVKQLLSYENITIYVVDNASSFNIDIGIQDKRFKIIKLKENTGIANAQNVGIKYLIADKVEFILFFDQDSNIPNNYVNDLLDDYKIIRSKVVKIGAIGPRFIDERYGFYYKTVNMSKYGFREKLDTSNIVEPLHSSLLISSGSLIAADTLKVVGDMRENYFIDYVDTEWCIRAEALGYQNYVSSKAIMKHAIGDNILNFKYFKVPVHSPNRRYYRVRNAFYMAKEKHVPTLLVLREMLFNFIHQVILVTFEKQKINYIKSYLKAIRDGFLYLLK